VDSERRIKNLLYKNIRLKEEMLHHLQAELLALKAELNLNEDELMRMSPSQRSIRILNEILAANIS
jgi:hypothetical protein